MYKGLYPVLSSTFKILPWFELNGHYNAYAMYLGNNKFLLDRCAIYLDNLKITINGLNYRLTLIKTNYDLFLSLWEINVQLNIEPCQFSDEYEKVYAIDISKRRHINIEHVIKNTSPNIYLDLFKTNQINFNEIVINEKGHIIGISNKNNLITPSRLIQLFINNMFETFKTIPLKIKNNGTIENIYSENNGLYKNDIIQSINNQNISSYIFNSHLFYEYQINLIRNGVEMSVNVLPQPQDDLLKYPSSFHEYYVNLTKRNYKIIKGFIFAYISHELLNIYESILQKKIILSSSCDKVLRNNEVIVDNNTFGKKDIYLIDYQGNNQLNFPFKNNNSIIWYKIINFDSFDLMDESKNIRIKHKTDTFTITF